MDSQLKLPVITISRQYGAGGRTIARGLSKKFGIPWYDKDFVSETALKSGYSEEDINSEGERLSAGSRFLNSVLNSAASYSSSHDGIYLAQKQVILELSASPCIIVGRCANYILKEAKIPCVSIFLYADLKSRLKRAAELGENGGMNLEKYVEKVDSQRDTYCRNYTHHPLGDCSLYDLCLNTGRMSVDDNVELCAKMIEALSR
ncbi:MAG: AAA family ATPase [Lachnospiraceae bacterium]|jgi:cytidylate kinase